jgi:uncharacterized membrane protein
MRTGLIGLVEIASTLLELFGILILLYTGVRTFIGWAGHKEDVSLDLGESIAMALEFLLAAEVMHTVIAQQVSDLIILGALVVLRAVMTIEIHWELKNEKKEKEEKHHSSDVSSS